MVEVKEYTKIINGQKVPVKAYTRNEPILSASEYLSNLKAPLEEESGEMKVQFSINVPSTLLDKEISKQEFNRRINETEEFLTGNFGGKTSIKALGGYMFKGKVINEGITKVESSMSVKKYEHNKNKIEAFIKSKQKEWKQDSIGYNFEGDFHLYPKQNWMKEDNNIDN